MICNYTINMVYVYIYTFIYLYVYIYLYIMRNSRPFALLTYHKKCQCVEINLQISTSNFTNVIDINNFIVYYYCLIILALIYTCKLKINFYGFRDK